MPLEKLKIVLEFLERDETDRAPASFHVLPDGAIVRRDWSIPMQFTFRCFGIPVSARVTSSRQGLVLVLKAILGNVPFTAEAAEARRALLSEIRSADGIVRTDGREVRAEDTIMLPSTVKPTALIGVITDFMLRLEPEIASLSASMVGRPSALGASDRLTSGSRSAALSGPLEIG